MSAIEGTAAAGACLSRRRMLAPLMLTQFIASFAGANMNVAINSIAKDLDLSSSNKNAPYIVAMGALAVLAPIGLGAAWLLPRNGKPPTTRDETSDAARVGVAADPA